jgi:hypothetical protein
MSQYWHCFATVLNTTGDLAAATLVASFPENGHEQVRKVL